MEGFLGPYKMITGSDNLHSSMDDDDDEGDDGDDEPPSFKFRDESTDN